MPPPSRAAQDTARRIAAAAQAAAAAARGGFTIPFWSWAPFGLNTGISGLQDDSTSLVPQGDSVYGMQPQTAGTPAAQSSPQVPVGVTAAVLHDSAGINGSIIVGSTLIALAILLSSGKMDKWF